MKIFHRYGNQSCATHYVADSAHKEIVPYTTSDRAALERVSRIALGQLSLHYGQDLIEFDGKSGKDMYDTYLRQHN